MIRPLAVRCLVCNDRSLSQRILLYEWANTNHIRNVLSISPHTNTIITHLLEVGDRAESRSVDAECATQQARSATDYAEGVASVHGELGRYWLYDFSAEGSRLPHILYVYVDKALTW